MNPVPCVTVVDSDFGDCEIEQSVVERSGLRFNDARSLRGTERTRVIRDAAGLLVQYEHIGEDVMADNPVLRGIVPYGVGTDMIDTHFAEQHNIRIAPVLDYCVDEVADHALALTLASMRRIVPLANAVRGGQWPGTEDIGDLRSLAGRRFAVVGYGSIGRAVLRRAKAFGAVPAAYDPFVASEIMRTDGVDPVTLEDAFRCDVVSLHLPLTAQTKGLVSNELLRLLPSGGLLVNVARGGVIDETALRAALDGGRIMAGLDVLTSEPPEIGQVLIGAPNSIITPHAAWYSEAAIQRLRTRAATTIAEIVRDAFAPSRESLTKGSHRGDTQ